MKLSGNSKKCSKCGQVKPITDFPLCGKGRRRPECKKCSMEWHKKHYRLNRVLILEGKKKSQHNYYLKNRDKIIQKHREYNKQNKERIKEYGKKYRAKNRANIYRRNSERHIHDKIVLNLELGGKCQDCGYHELIAILEIHHLKGKDTKEQFQKEFKRWKQIGELPKNVILLCPNCHAERHYGIKDLNWGEFNGIKVFED